MEEESGRQDTLVSYARQTGFFNPEENAGLHVAVFGAGSVGSHVVYSLAKLGVRNITVYDFDTVEVHNVPNQFYKVSQVGQSKVSALAENVREFTGTSINTVAEKVTEDSFLLFPIGSLVVLAFDNIEARKLVFGKLKGNQLTVIDIRAGGEGWSIQVVDASDEEECASYEATLEGVFSTLPCGMQTVIYNILNLTSEACNTVKRLSTKQSYNVILRRSMKAALMVAKVKPAGV